MRFYGHLRRPKLENANILCFNLKEDDLTQTLINANIVTLSFILKGLRLPSHDTLLMELRNQQGDKDFFYYGGLYL